MKFTFYDAVLSEQYYRNRALTYRDFWVKTAGYLQKTIWQP